MARPDAPLPLPGHCHTCGYQAHPADCAVHPCHRCHHDHTTRNDGTKGYVIEAYMECPCPCHRWWRWAYDTALESGGTARYVPAKAPRGRHSPQEGDFE
jgi:hypothetical protein